MRGDAAGLGQVNVDFDSDGVIRRTYMVERDGERAWPHLMAFMQAAAEGTPRPASAGAAAGPARAPLLREAPLLVSFAGPPGHFRTVSFVDVVNGATPAEFLRDKLVLVGATADGLGDRYATPLHGRTKDGQVVPMSWHCEDAAINYSELKSVTRAWHEIIADLRRRTDVFDDWGMFAYTQGSTGVDYLTEIDVGIWEQQLDDRAWALWVDAKRAIARVALDHGGSISACHGSCREGEVDLVPEELGRGFDVMLDIKRTLDPNNIMNPGKYLLDRAYEGEG